MKMGLCFKTVLSLSFFIMLFQVFISNAFADAVSRSFFNNSQNNNDYIISKGKAACNARVGINKRKSKKITICPIKSNYFNLGNIKKLARNYYKLRNIIYVICFVVLCFIWARARYQELIEWKMFFSVFLTVIFVTIMTAIVNWYVLYDDVYLYYCKKDNVLWFPCVKGNESISVYKKDVVILDSDGNILKNKVVSDRLKSHYKVNMFY